jgi:hypothetical protein
MMEKDEKMATQKKKKFLPILLIFFPPIRLEIAKESKVSPRLFFSLSNPGSLQPRKKYFHSLASPL